MPSHRARGSLLDLVLYHGVHNWIITQRVITHQPVYKRLHMFIVRKLPWRAMKPERVRRRQRQDHISIHQIFDRQRGEKCARLKLDDKPLRALGMGLRRRFRHWTLARDAHSCMLFEKEQVPMTIGRASRSVMAPGSTAPDHFDVRRVRRSSLEEKAHASTPNTRSRTYSYVFFRTRTRSERSGTTSFLIGLPERFLL